MKSILRRKKEIDFKNKNTEIKFKKKILKSNLSKK